MSDLYTIVLDYKGGTYISQKMAGDLHSALNHWTSNLEDEDLALWEISRSDLQIAIQEKAIAIEGLKNVWCVSDSADNNLILINIIKTAP